MTPRWQPEVAVVSRRLDDEVVLINLRTNRMFSLNRTGARAWELLQTGHDWSAVRSALLDEFDVEPETLDGELDALSSALEIEGFMTRRELDAARTSEPVGERQITAGRQRPSGVRAIASLLVRMGAWSLALPVLKHVVPLPRLVRLVTPRSARGRSSEHERLVVRIAGRIYRGRRPGTCLERSLLAFRYLSRVSADPRLVIGVRRDDPDVMGHAWVVVDGSPIYESKEFLDSFVPVVMFDADGYATTAVGVTARASS